MLYSQSKDYIIFDNNLGLQVGKPTTLSRAAAKVKRLAIDYSDNRRFSYKQI